VPPPALAGCVPWQWANSLPQGHTLNVVPARGEAAVAVAGAGTLRVSDDHAATWSLRNAGVDE